MEFLSYASNNGLTPFFYNSESDFRRWGNLAERKNRRGEKIVDLSLRGRRKASAKKEAAKPRKKDLPGLSLEQKLKRKREVDWLLTGLTDSDPLIRQKSAESLGRLADPDIFPHLSAAVEDDEPEVRQEIVRAIGVTRNPRAEGVLLKVVEEDEILSVQLTAAHVLRKMNSKALIPLLLDGIEKGKPHFSSLLAFHPGLKGSRPAQLRLTAMTVSEDPQVRRETAFVLRKLPTKESRGALLRLTDDEDETTRIHALYSLWGLRHHGVASAAMKMQGHYSEATVRAGTIVGNWVGGHRK
jgi:HEAT repeat protein